MAAVSGLPAKALSWSRVGGLFFVYTRAVTSTFTGSLGCVRVVAPVDRK